MKNPVYASDIKQALDKICRSETFAKSPRNIRLLNFIVEQSINEVFIKEQVIGIELFKNKYDSSQNDGKVRVYMFNLRKKLIEYYLKEGKNDTLVFEIAKGQYNINFIPRNELPKSKRFKSKIAYSSIALFTAIITLSVSYWLFTGNKNNYCWNSFFNSNAQTTCIISDHKIFSSRLNDGSIGFVRNTNINDERQLNALLLKNQHLDYRLADFTFITKMAPLAIKELSSWFISHDKDFSVLLESEFSYEDIRHQNLVFIGQSKTMDKTRSLFLRNSKVFSINIDTITYTNSNESIKYTNSIIKGKRLDYTIVSFAPLDKNTNALFFSSNNDIGVITTVKNFTNKEWLDEFYATLPNRDVYFNALFMVSGVGRTELDFKLVQIEVLEKTD